MARPAPRRPAAAVASVVLASLVAGAASPAGRAVDRPRRPTGDAKGLALLARVHRAYARVPGVEVYGSSGTFSFRFRLVLDAGLAVGEEFVGHEPSRVTTLVARRGGPTYARQPGSSCWQALPASSPQAFGNIGLPFPDQPAMRVLAPHATAAGWALRAVVDGDPGTFAIDRGSLRVRSITLEPRGGPRILEHVGELASAPRLLSPTPRC